MSEKIADIVAQIRAAAYIQNADTPESVLRLADRIEAAWKRETAIHAMTCEANERLREHLEIALEDNKRTIGNAAAMREAMEKLRERFARNVMAYQDLYLKFSGWHWTKKAAEASKWRDVFSGLMDECDAALAKPPRNCDVFNTPVGAEEAFDNYFCQKMKTGRCNPANCDLPTKTGAVYCLTAWLYAPATERARQDR